MTYCSNYYKRSWQCDPDGDDFQDKLGRLLSGGKDLKASMRASALASVGHNVDFEKQHGEGAATPSISAAFYQQGPNSNGGSPPGSAEAKMVWVDGKGQYIEGQMLSPRRTERPMLPYTDGQSPAGSPRGTTRGSPRGSPRVGGTPRDRGSRPTTPAMSQMGQSAPLAQTLPNTLTRSQSLYMGMTPTERSCYSWKHINPGCMECTLKLPTTSMKDHYSFDASKVEPVNRRMHLKKTEFSEYTETKARVMHHIT